MERLTLNKTWKLCLQVWKWIAEQKKEKKRRSVIDLKRKWCKENNFNMENDCFFCEYDGQRNDDCQNCPAKKIDNNFFCWTSEYHFRKKPIAFYKKLLELNKKRLSKK